MSETESDVFIFKLAILYAKSYFLFVLFINFIEIIGIDKINLSESMNKA